VDYQYGHHLLAEPFLLGENAQRRALRAFSSVSARVSFRPPANRPGHNHWRQRHGFPEQGLGVARFDLGSPHELGWPVAVFYGFRAPLTRGRVRLSYTTDVGLATGWRTYDYVDNPYNLLVSTRTTAYLHLGIGGEVWLAPHLNLLADVGLSHFSNGNLSKPNAGLNAITPTVGLRYVNHRRPVAHTDPLPPFTPHTEWVVTTFAGAERRLYYPGGIAPEHRQRGISHSLFGLTLLGLRQVGPNSKIGFGTSFTHRVAGDLWLEAPDGRLDYSPTPPEFNNVRIGVFPTYERVYGRFSFLVQAEYSLRAPWTEKAFDRFRQKIGLKCHLGSHAFLAVVLNARQFSMAEYLEWHVGYAISPPPPR
jgi:hypothetical protein